MITAVHTGRRHPSGAAAEGLRRRYRLTRLPGRQWNSTLGPYERRESLFINPSPWGRLMFALEGPKDLSWTLTTSLDANTS